MALIKCSECGREVSDKAAACPQCGAPIVAQAVAAVPVVARPAASPPPPVKAKPSVRVLTLVLLIVLAGVGYVVFKMTTGSSLRSAVAGPETITSETISLNEGEGRDYSFSFPLQRKVEVAVTATPKAVNVYLMNEQDLKSYTEARKKLGGAKFTHRQVLSSDGVLNMRQTEMLPAGMWHIVVERPSESLFGGKATAATVRITAL